MRRKVKASNPAAPIGKQPALRNTRIPLDTVLLAVRVSKHAKAKRGKK